MEEPAEGLARTGRIAGGGRSGHYVGQRGSGTPVSWELWTVATHQPERNHSSISRQPGHLSLGCYMPAQRSRPLGTGGGLCGDLRAASGGRLQRWVQKCRPGACGDCWEESSPHAWGTQGPATPPRPVLSFATVTTWAHTATQGHTYTEAHLTHTRAPTQGHTCP